MKRNVIIVSILLQCLVLWMNCAIAQPSDPSDISKLPDYSGLNNQVIMPAANHLSAEFMGGAPIMPDILEARNHVMQMIMSLGLDQNQIESIHQIIDTTAKEYIKKMSDLLIAIVDFEDIIQREPIDLNAAELKLKQIESLKTSMFLMPLRAREETESILTPAQKDRFMKMFDMHRMYGNSMAEEKKSDPDEKNMSK